MRVEVHSSDLRKLSADLRKHGDGKAIRRDLVKGLREAVKPVVPKVRAAYLSNPGSGKGGLRVSLARATSIQVATSGRDPGVRIKVDGRKMPDRKRSLPEYYEGEERRWRHPVYGNREVWVTQPSRPTFYRVVRPQVPLVRRGIERVVADIAKRLARG